MRTPRRDARLPHSQPSTADAGDSHTYAITNDPSGFFEIVGDEVRVAAGANIDFETDQSHDITVQTTDAAGNTYSEVVTICGQRPDRREPDGHHPDRRFG